MHELQSLKAADGLGRFTGSLLLGITEISGMDSDTLWLGFVKTSEFTKTWGILTRPNQKPTLPTSGKPTGLEAVAIDDERDNSNSAIQQRAPDVVAVAPRSVWESSLRGRGEDFFRNVESGAVHISGDYRLFGRFTPSLLRFLMQPATWECLDDIISVVAAAQAS